MVSGVVGRITGGHDTADLRAAQTQLSQIDPPTDDWTRTLRERSAPRIEHPQSQMERVSIFP
jgi:hypothetical protein